MDNKFYSEILDEYSDKLNSYINLVMFNEGNEGDNGNKKSAGPTLADKLKARYEKDVENRLTNTKEYKDMISKSANQQLSNLVKGRSAGRPQMPMGGTAPSPAPMPQQMRPPIPMQYSAFSVPSMNTYCNGVSKSKYQSFSDHFEEVFDEWCNYAQPPMPPQGMPMPMPPGQPPRPGMPMPPQGMPGPGMPPPAPGAPMPPGQGPMLMDPDGDAGSAPPMIDPDGNGPMAPVPLTRDENGGYQYDPDGQGPQQPVKLNIAPQKYNAPKPGDQATPQQAALNSPEAAKILDNVPNAPGSPSGGPKPPMGGGDKSTPPPSMEGMTPEKMKKLKEKLAELGMDVTPDGQLLIKPDSPGFKLPKHTIDKMKEMPPEELDPQTDTFDPKVGGISKTPGLPGTNLSRLDKEEMLNKMKKEEMEKIRKSASVEDMEPPMPGSDVPASVGYSDVSDRLSVLQSIFRM